LHEKDTMPKKRHKPPPNEDPDDTAGSAADPLGELMSRYHVSLVGVLIVSGAVAFVGLGLIGCAMIWQSLSMIFLLIGTAVLLVAVALLGMNVFNVGRRVEVRKRGIRFVEAGVETEMFWEDIVDIQVNRTDDTALSVVSVRKRGSHYATPSGPLTSTEWDVAITVQDGRTIHLRPAFLKLVPDVRKLVSQMKMRAGL
jgi:hypothetical protein